MTTPDWTDEDEATIERVRKATRRTPWERRAEINELQRRVLEETAKERGAARAYLEVRVSNAAAIALYESRGYRKLHVRKRYYPDGEDAYAMSKRLLPDGAAEMRSAETGSL